MPDALSSYLPDEAATRSLGRALGAALQGGDVIALLGPLGAGKTTLIQGLARALGVPPEVAVNSPTFAICAEHRGRDVELLHVDLYRLEDADEAESIGLVERLGEAGWVSVLEWADRIPEILPSGTLWIRLQEEAAGRRVFLWEGGGGDVSWAAELRLPEGSSPWTTTSVPTPEQ